jgi:hypothetical protein
MFAHKFSGKRIFYVACANIKKKCSVNSHVEAYQNLNFLDNQLRGIRNSVTA